MTKFQKMQKLSSIIPVFSTVFVSFVTMLELKRRKASAKLWLYFFLIFFFSGISAYLVNAFVMTGKNPVLNVVVSGLIFAIANILFVELQIIAARGESETAQKDNLRKVILLSCIAAGIFVAGSVVAIVWKLGAPSIDIADTNGSENICLTTITTEEILRSANDYSAFGYSESRKGERTGVVGKQKAFDFDCVAFQCKKISGVKTLQVTKATSDTMTLEINSQLFAGNLEIIITVDDQLYKSVEVNDVSAIELSGVEGKIVVVKIGAESAEFNISIARSV